MARPSERPRAKTPRPAGEAETIRAEPRPARGGEGSAEPDFKEMRVIPPASTMKDVSMYSSTPMARREAPPAAAAVPPVVAEGLPARG
ncbi:MAG: hypothetical protein HYR98_01030 [Nitrospirae bacterium]|nr:hypothetical protein [Nitrospirota bacterium]